MNSPPPVLRWLSSKHTEHGVVRTFETAAAVTVSRQRDGLIGLLVTRSGESAAISLTDDDARHLIEELSALVAS